MNAEHRPTKKHKIRRKATKKRLVNIAVVFVVGLSAIHFSLLPALIHY